MGRNLDDISRHLVPWLIARRRRVLIAALILSLVGIFFSVRLYSDLRSELEELLPVNAPSVVAAHKLSPRLHSIAKLSIDMAGSNPDAIDRFIEDLVARLRQLPPSLVGEIDYRTDQQERFVRQFGGLYLSLEDLQKLRDQISARMEWERTNNNPLALESGADLGPPPKVDIAGLEAKYEGDLGAETKFRNGYYQTPDGRLALVEVRLPEAALGLKKNKALLDAVKSIVASLHPQSYDRSLEVGYSGDVAELVEEQEALVKDLASSTVIVTIGVLFVLWFYYRGWLAVLAVLMPLTVGCALTFGLSDFLIGHLNANTAFLGSIVVGNGINPGIIFVARYLEERRRGTTSDEAIRRAWSATLPATFVASIGAGLAYLSLAVTDFRGFNQFGVIGGLGMGLCWSLTYLLGPAVLAALEAWRGFRLRQNTDERPIASRVASWVEAHTRALRVASVLVVATSFVAVGTYRGNPVEYDWTRLRSKKAVESGSVYWSHLADQVWRSYQTPVVLWSDNTAELERAVSVLEQRSEALGKQSPIQSIRTIQSLIPPDQDEKLPVLAEIRRQLKPSVVKKLPRDLREKARRFRPADNLRPVTFADLPEAWRNALSERNGTVGHIAAIFPKPIADTNMRGVRDLKRFVRGAVADAGGDVLVYSQVFLMSDINEAINRDGPISTFLALGLVCALVALVLRQLVPTLYVIASLLVGVVMLVGVAAALHVRINFLNFVVLPISFGIGVDYAINIVQRYRVEGVAALHRILSETGGAVALCSSTTVIGYGSLWVADSQALAGFGLLAALGEIMCLSAALLLLPAWLWRVREAGSTRTPVDLVGRLRRATSALTHSRASSSR